MKQAVGFFILLLSLGGCEILGVSGGGFVTEPVRGDFSEIADPRERWEAYGLTDYTINQTRQCFCPPPRAYAIVVRDGDVVAVRNPEPPVEQGEMFLEQFMTVDELFDLIESAKQQNPAKLEVSYHPRFGFPTEVDIDISGQIADEELYMTLSDLRALPR